MDKVFWCKNCLNMSTRHRITFDNKGWCNACQWMEEKKTINWKKREEELFKLIKVVKSNNSNFDCLVPVSGGKDGSYVSHTLKKKYNLNPLTVTIRPPLSIDLGKKNLSNFINSGFNHIHITPNFELMKKLNRLGFIEKGFPYYGWLIAISTAILRVASSFNIGLVFYGEDGEVEYGGSDETKYKCTYDVNYQKRIYLEKGYDKILEKLECKESDKYFFTYPSDEELSNIYVTHWSYFESWDPYRNYLVAKKFCGLQEQGESNSGTFTNFAQNDQALYALHTYLMYLKFGFGRATQDAGIEIRRGAMTRDQAINLVKLYDGKFPEEYLQTYLDYFELSNKEFDIIIDKWANKKLFVKKDNFWIPKFNIE